MAGPGWWSEEPIAAALQALFHAKRGQVGRWMILRKFSMGEIHGNPGTRSGGDLEFLTIRMVVNYPRIV